MKLQINDFDPELNELQKKYGDQGLCAINGAGCVDKPRLLLLFMNPTGRNVSADPSWKGIRAPWIGTKNIWKMLFNLGLISEELYALIRKLKPSEWTPSFSQEVYTQLAKKKIYITNLAKCTQVDARSLPNSVFKSYRELTCREFIKVNPEKIVSFGVQVSTILLGKKIELKKVDGEALLILKKEFRVYPTYYPVGQGMRNMAAAVDRIRELL